MWVGQSISGSVGFELRAILVLIHTLIIYFKTLKYIILPQILGTALLLLFVMALTDANNSGPHKGFVPLLVGLAVLAIGLSLGTNAGR